MRFGVPHLVALGGALVTPKHVTRHNLEKLHNGTELASQMFTCTILANQQHSTAQEGLHPSSFSTVGGPPAAGCAQPSMRQQKF
jgi:hypothetical protein